MNFIPNTNHDIVTMLRQIGVASVSELFSSIPDAIKVDGLLRLPDGLSEMELESHVRTFTAGDVAASDCISFLGGGAYDHFVPAVVDALADDPRFVTAYTPYQAEASQGSLQLFFEYQTLVARLTGMDLSNASHYDAATASVEAMLMAKAANGRSKIIVAETVSSQYRQVFDTYLLHQSIELVVCPATNGSLNTEELTKFVDDKTACVVVQHPNTFGNVEQVDEISQTIHAAGGLFIAIVDPISLGILKRPIEYGADIVVAEGQPLGIPTNFGGPYLGILACRDTLLRRIPGRIVGETVDRRGNRCWVLTMQTREQHIRREKASSNICSNQGLMAVRASIYLALLGANGLREVANLCTQKAHYLAQQLAGKTRLKLTYPDATFFKEFMVTLPNNADANELCDKLAKQKIFAGIPHGNNLLIAVTEKRTKAEMDYFVEQVRVCLQ